jgi:hypothetical protein
MKSYHLSDLFKTTWNELTPGDLLSVYPNSLQLKAARESGDYKRFGFLAIAILRVLRKNKSAVAKINIDQAVDCVNDLDFLWKPWFHFPTLSNQDVRQNTRDYTPEENLRNHSFGQLFWIDSLFSKYIIQEYLDSRAFPPQNPSPMAEAYLNEMIYVIYTPSTLFDERNIGKGGKIMKGLTNDERFMIFHTYANVKEFIIQSCPNIFPITGEGIATSDGMPPDSEPMWKSLMFDLSETPAYQGINQTKQANMYEALDYLERKFKELKPNNQK